MNVSTVQAAPDWRAFRRWYLLIAALLAALLLILWLLGYGPGGSACKLPAPPVAAVVAPAPVAAVVAPAPVVTSPVVSASVVTAPVALPPAARVYFGLDKTALPGDVDKTLSEVVAYLKANGGTKALISGFHDPSGDKAHNEELALNRARGVRAELDKLGIPNDRVVMAKPAETTGTGEAREARRVEVSVQVP